MDKLKLVGELTIEIFKNGKHIDTLIINNTIPALGREFILKHLIGESTKLLLNDTADDQKNAVFYVSNSTQVLGDDFTLNDLIADGVYYSKEIDNGYYDNSFKTLNISMYLSKFEANDLGVIKKIVVATDTYDNSGVPYSYIEIPGDGLVKSNEYEYYFTHKLKLVNE